MPQATIEWDSLRESDPALLARVIAMSGLERVQAMVSGELPTAPMFAAFGMRAVEVELGRVVFEVDPPPYSRNGMGLVHGGLHATAMDTATGAAIMTHLDAETGLVTGDMHVRYRRSVTVGTLLRVEASTDHVGRRTATADARVVDAEGRTVATASVGYHLVRRGQRS